MMPAVVEFLGAALLISAVAFGKSPLLIVAALAIAIAFGGDISGGHFNPAITFFKYLTGKVSQTKAMWYIGAQYSASILIFLFYSNM